MTILNTSTVAALEEMLQNSARSAPPDFMPIILQGGRVPRQTIGHLNPELIPFLQASLAKQSIALLHLGHDCFTIGPATPGALSASLGQLANLMRQGGFIPGWRNEAFSWIDEDNHAYFQLERAAFRTFGLRSNAAHVNGYTKKGQLWLGRRSESKATDPGLLDNLAAGGISADEAPWVCAKRELWEEAGVPEHLAAHIVPAGRIHMQRATTNLGFHDEVLMMYDLELPDQFVPSNHDGEVSGFIQISFSEAAARILADEFTIDAAFVTADFLLRHSKS
jgi:8-oxo-dGTP pyrophosphatase MutT (NUDIX family)